MAIKIQTKRNYLPIEIGDLTLEFDMTDENIERLYNTHEEMAKKFDKVDTNSPEKAREILKEAFDYILGEGAFEKIYALSGSIITTTEYFEAITLAIRDKVQERTVQTSQQQSQHYLKNKKK